MDDAQARLLLGRVDALDEKVREIERKVRSLLPVRESAGDDAGVVSPPPQEAQAAPIQLSAPSLVVRSEQHRAPAAKIVMTHESSDKPQPGPYRVPLLQPVVEVQGSKFKVQGSGLDVPEPEGAGSTPPHIPAPPISPPASAASAPRAPRNFDLLRSADFWLNKVGIALFLFGVAFLFKYSVDQGWLNEQVRVGAGLLFGTLLIGFGLLVHGKRRHFSHVLMGGGIATYYITGYAAYQLFPGLQVPYSLALGFMVGVTFLAFALSVRQDEITLSMIGLIGGMLTPFVLDDATLRLPGLVGYTCLILGCATGVYLVKGWRSLLWGALQVGSSVLFFGFHDRLYGGTLTLDDRWALQAGAVFGLVAFWGVPVLRDALSALDPARWPTPRISFIKDDYLHYLIDKLVYPLAAMVPAVLFGFSWLVWGELVSREVWGLVALGGAALFGLVYWLLRRVDVKLAYLHAMLAVAAVTTGVASLLEGDALLFALAAEGAALYLASRRFKDLGTELWGHALFVAAGGWLAARLMGATLVPAFFNASGLTDLAVIALAVGASFIVRTKEAALVIRGCAHVALLAWIWREGHGFPEGAGYVALAWVGYALLMHAASRYIPDRANAIATSIAAHLAFGAALETLASRLISEQRGALTMLNERALLDLGVIALALAASFAVRPISDLRWANMGVLYRLFVHAAALGWLWREATPLDHEAGYVMLRWAVYLATVALVSHRVGDRVTPLFLHAPWVAVVIWYGNLMWHGAGSEYAFMNVTTLMALAAVGCAMATSFVARPGEARAVYRIVAHAGVLALLWRELWLHSVQLDLATLSWAAYLAGVQLLSWRLSDRAVSVVAHLPFIAVAFAVTLRVLLIRGFWSSGEQVAAFLNGQTYVDVAIIGLALLISMVAQPALARGIYRGGVHLAVLGVLWRELHWLDYGDGYVLLAWAAYAALLHAVAWRARHSETRWVGHALFGVCGVWLLGRFIAGLLTVNEDAFAVLNPKGLADLGVIALGVTVYALAGYPRRVSAAYGWWLHFALLGWAWQELGLIPQNDGNAYVSIAWGVYGIALVLAGLWRDRSRPLLMAGIGTLFAVAAKLFLIDLQYVGVEWRIALFLGFGAAFLLFSYYLGGQMNSSKPERKRRLNRGDAESAELPQRTTETI